MKKTISGWQPHSIAAKMARMFIVVAAAIAVVITASGVTAASQDMVVHPRHNVPSADTAHPKCECPRYECPRCRCPTTTSLYRRVNDALNKHPWLHAPFMGLCNIIRAYTGVFGVYAIDYVALPTWVSMRAYERYTMIASTVFETVVLVACSSIMMGSGWSKIASAVTGWVSKKMSESKPQTHVKVGDAPEIPEVPEVPEIPETRKCNAVVEKTGKPCTKPGPTQRDGRWVCGVHARSRRITYV